MSKRAKPHAIADVPGLAGFRLSTQVVSVTPHADWRIGSAAAIDREIVAALLAARRHAGMSQRELAYRMGRRQSYAAKIEALKRNMLAHELLLMCALLERDPSELIEQVMDRPEIRARIDSAPPFSKRVQS